MNFENSVWLLWTPLIVLATAGLIAWSLQQRKHLLSQFAAARLLNQLTEKASLQRIVAKAGLILIALTLIGIALARPQYGIDSIERKARGLDIVFALDSSKSMLATDLRPNRLERAKLAILDLIERLESDRIGLVVFAGNAFLQTPPTLDYPSFRDNLKAVGSSSISRGGSNIGQALREAVKAFPKDDNFKVVILLTDGEDLEEKAVDTAGELAADNIKIYSIGIGTPEGIYLKVKKEDGTDEYIRDSKGQPVRSQLDETTLRKIAQLTDGSYSRLTGQSLDTLYNSVLATLPREERESELQETRIERYQWFIGAALILLILELLIRRRTKVSTPIVLLLVAFNLINPTPSLAVEANQDLPEELSSDPRVLYNQANENILEGNFAKAKELYEQSIESSDSIDLEQDGLYNMAHAMNQMGEQAFKAQDFETAIEHWKQAEELFQSANELNPQDSSSLEDAQQMEQRRTALEEFLQQQQNQEEQQQNDNSDEEQQNSEEETSENESESSDASQEEDSESQNSQDSQNSSESDNSESQKDASSQESSENEEGSESSRSESESESSENAGEEQSDDETATESDEEADTNEENKEAALSEPSSDEADDSTGEQVPGTVIEGMSISDAQLLLDSLRDNERILPYAEPSEAQGRKGEVRDW